MHLTSFYPLRIFESKVRFHSMFALHGFGRCPSPVTVSGRAFTTRFPMKKLGELKQLVQSLTQNRFSENSKKPQKNSGMISKKSNYVIFNNSFLIAWILKYSVHIFVFQKINNDQIHL